MPVPPRPSTFTRWYLPIVSTEAGTPEVTLLILSGRARGRPGIRRTFRVAPGCGAGRRAIVGAARRLRGPPRPAGGESLVVGLGVDLVEIDRVARAIARWGDRFVDKLMDPEEAGRLPRGPAV